MIPHFQSNNSILDLFRFVPVKDRFLDEILKVITSRKKVSITKDAGWYSEAELKSDLKWSPHLS